MEAFAKQLANIGGEVANSLELKRLSSKNKLMHVAFFRATDRYIAKLLGVREERRVRSLHKIGHMAVGHMDITIRIAHECR